MSSSREIQESEALIKYIGDLRTAHVKLLSEGKLTEAEKVKEIIDREAVELANLTGQESFQKTRAAATARSLITAFDAFLTSINTAPQGGGFTPAHGRRTRRAAPSRR